MLHHEWITLMKTVELMKITVDYSYHGAIEYPIPKTIDNVIYGNSDINPRKYILQSGYCIDKILTN